jgi:hypothetical protein
MRQTVHLRQAVLLVLASSEGKRITALRLDRAVLIGYILQAIT